MSLVDSLQPGVRLYDRATGQVRTLHHVEVYASVVYLSFLNALTGGVSREPFPRAELESRFEVATGEAAFRGNPETVRRMADTVCSAAKPGGLSGLAEQLLSAAPGLDFTFRVVITAMGQSLDEKTRQRLNALLDKVHPGWRWESDL